MTTSANAPAITEQTIRELSKRRNEPSWLLDRRLDAWRAYQAMAMPNPLEEEWRRTDISALDVEAALTGFEASSATGLVSPDSKVVYKDLSEAATSNRELVEPYLHSLVKPSDWKLQALEAALWEGALIHVQRGH